MASTQFPRFRGAHAILLVLTLTLFAGAVGIFTLESRRFLGTVCASILLTLAAGRAVLSWRWWVFMSTYLILLYATRRPELWLLLTTAVLWIGIGAGPNANFGGAKPYLAAAAGVFTGLFLVSRLWPAVWIVLEKVVQGISEWAGRVSGSGISYGATAAGLWVFLALLATGVACVAHAEGKAGRTLALVFCGMVSVVFLAYLIWGESLALWARGVVGEQFTRYPGAQRLFNDRAVVALHGQLILLAAGLIAAVWLLPQVRLSVPRPEQSPAGKWKRGVAFAALAVIGAIATFQIPMARTGAIKVLFYGNGMLDWRVPVHGVIGIGQAGMFGLLPRYLELAGFHSTHLQRAQPVTAKDLQEAQVFVVINPTRQFSAQEMKDIWDFVGRGGGLLVLGDHTDLMGIMGPLNQLLEPVPIRFRFDSAFSIRHWAGDYEWFEHPVTRRLDSSNDLLQQGTGASLELGNGAFPLVAGKFAFSDAGDRENKLNAFLGDYRYQTGELLSDVVIIAGARYGAGRVVVFGDTTAFQNLAICRSGSFVSDLFSHLSIRARHGWIHTVQKFTAICAGIAVLGSCLWGLTLQRAGWGCLALATGMVLGGVPGRQFDPVPFDAGPIAFIDTMHVNEFSQEFWLADSIGGLTTNLERNGLLPLMLRDAPLEVIAKGKILICISPAKPYSRRELQVVEDFMHRGGLVIVSVGYQQREGARSLLALAQFDIGSAPLGPVPLYQKTMDQQLIQQIMQQPHMMEAWPIKAPGGLDKSYYRSGENDIIGFKRIGLGGMLLIADPRFLLDKTLEEETTGWPGNMKLLRQFVEELTRREQG